MAEGTHTIDPPVGPARSRSREWLPVGVVLAIIFVVHVWIISAGHMWPSTWPAYDSHYYGMLSDAFLHGQADLLVRPDPRLLGLADSYDPAINQAFRLHDAILYRGNYYLYWGPVPAVLLIPVRLFSGGEIPDAFLLFGFVEGVMAMTALLLARIRKDFFPNGSRYTLLLTIFAAGLSMPIPFILARAAVYETAIIGGQVFLLSGIYFAMTAFGKSAVEAIEESGGTKRMRLAFAGVCWALAVGCRASLAPAVGVLALLVAGRIFFSDRPRPGRRRSAALALLVLPLIVGAALLGWYNAIRFGSWHDTGLRYQLAAIPMQTAPQNLFAVDYFTPNLGSYLFRPWRWATDFPSIMAAEDMRGLPAFIHRPSSWTSEPVTGIVWTSPLVGLIAVPLCRLGRPAHWRGQSDLNCIVVWLFAAGLVGFLPVLLLTLSTMRYFADMTPSLFVLAGIGVWQLEQRLGVNRRRRSDVLVLCTISSAYSGIVAIMLAVTGYQFHFMTNNRPLFEKLAGWLSGA